MIGKQNHSDRFIRPSRTFVPLLLAGALAGALLASATWAGARSTAGAAQERLAPLSKAFKGRLPITELNEDEAILHALNRLGYGPRPGDVDRVRKMGLERWIDQQLHPETIDDSALAARLDAYPTLAMSPAKLLEDYPAPEMAAKRMGISVEEYRKRQEATARQQAAAGQGMRAPGETGPQRVVSELAMAKLTRAIYSERQLNEQLADFWFNPDAAAENDAAGTSAARRQAGS